jgi:hypothetical protein
VCSIGSGRRWEDGRRPAAVEIYSSSVSKELKGKRRPSGVVLLGEMKKVGCRFGSATHAWRRAADGGARHGGAVGGAVLPMGARGGRRRPSGPYRAERPSGAGRFRWE